MKQSFILQDYSYISFVNLGLYFQAVLKLYHSSCLFHLFILRKWNVLPLNLECSTIELREAEDQDSNHQPLLPLLFEGAGTVVVWDSEPTGTLITQHIVVRHSPKGMLQRLSGDLGQ